MQMCFHQDIGMKDYSSIVMQKLHRVQDNTGKFRVGEQGKPVYNGTGGIIVFAADNRFISASSHSILYDEAEPHGLHSEAEPRNEEKGKK